MQRSLPALALVAVTLTLAACEQKPAATSPAAPAGDAAPAAASAAGGGSETTVGFELTDSRMVGALQIDVAYKGEGRFVGDADAVACETKIEGALSSYNHIVADKMLKAAFVAVKGFSGPLRFSECKFVGKATAADFEVTVKDASDPDLGEMNPVPAVKAVVD